MPVLNTTNPTLADVASRLTPDGKVDPQIVEKHQTRWAGFDDKIL